MHIRIYRKGKVTGRPTKAVRQAVENALLLARVDRPELIEFFLSGAFHKLPVVPPHVIKNAPLRQRDHLKDGWIIPEEEYGNVRREPEKAAQTILLYVIKYLVDTGAIDRSELAIVVDYD